MPSFGSQWRRMISATAKSAADAIVALRPSLPWASCIKAWSPRPKSTPEDALRLYTNAADLQPDATEPLEAVVRLLVGSKRLPEAIKRLDDVSARYPESSLALTIKGDVLLRTGKSAEAKDTFRQAIARTPEWWRPYRGLASARTRAQGGSAVGDSDPAKCEHRGRSDRGAEHCSSPRCSSNPARSNEAIQEYEEVIRSDPQSEVAANNLAMLLATVQERHREPRSREGIVGALRELSEPLLPGYLRLGAVQARRCRGLRAGADARRGQGAGCRASRAITWAWRSRWPATTRTRATICCARSIRARRFAGLDEAKATLDKLAKSPSTAAATPKT